MCSDSIVSLMPMLVEFVTQSRESHDGSDDFEVETPDRLVPLRWVYWGFGTSVTVGTFMLWTVFGSDGIKPWASLLGYMIGGLLSVLA